MATYQELQQKQQAQKVFEELKADGFKLLQEGKIDDIPAYLSNGEFVITAKAVKNAGGSKPMYDMMEHLEKGGKLSPASRGR